ncbi:transmembrane protein 132C [Denticeps clupeoides]|uniref:Transmembrane protein 132D-like n=1 Tax=Denticeps clupeoides TaxID=299321 RepID=A0AAY3ZW18_9TELE|nr:transmembrane protein 132C-like [Denticeps clupeoides]
MGTKLLLCRVLLTLATRVVGRVQAESTSLLVRYQVLNAEHLLLSDGSQVSGWNGSLHGHGQAFIITAPSGQPAVNASYGPISVERTVPPDLIQKGHRIRTFILAKQVRSSAPLIRVLFHLAGSGRDATNGQKSGHLCVTVYAFWEAQEVSGTCSLPADGGFCLARFKPEPSWFNTGNGRSSRERQGKGPGNKVDLFFQTRPSPSGQCVPLASQQRQGLLGLLQGVEGGSRSDLKRIGTVTLSRSLPGNPTLIRLKLAGSVVVQTSSRPLKANDVATFYVFLPSNSPVEHFILRAMVKKGLSFSSARPSDTRLWDIVLEPDRGGSTIAVLCQRKTAVTGKRGLLEVLQLDFETEELSDQSEIQMIAWNLELPGNIKDEGSMKIYTTQRDYVGLAPLIMDTDLLNMAVLTGKKVSVPVATLAVEADGSVTDITNFTSCRSTDEEVLKVAERCNYVFVDGKETRGRVRMTVNFTYSYLSTQLEVNVWMPRLPLHIDLSDSVLSQIKGWRVPVATGNNRKSSLDSEEEDERKVKGCMLQYQHSQVRILTPFTAEPSGQPAFFLGPGWQVDVTRQVRYLLRVQDSNVARLQGTVLSGKAVGSTTVQVMSPLSDSVLAERSVRVVDDKVSISELGVRLVSGLSLNLQLSPGSSKAVVATATTQDAMHLPKQEAVVGCWVQFSDGSSSPLDLYDSSGYSLTVISLNESVVSVQRSGPPAWVMVEGEGQGSLLRVELGICEACQKSRRKSKLAVGSGAIRVKYHSPAPLEWVENGGRNSEIRQAITSPQGLLLGLGLQENSGGLLTATSKPNLQEVQGAAISSIRGIAHMDQTTTIRPANDRSSKPVGGGRGVRKDPGNLMEILNNPKQPSQVEVPKREAPSMENGLVRRFGMTLTDLEIGMYALVGVSCLAILGFVLNCVSFTLKSHNKKTPVQSQGPREHRHHWVRLSTSSEQGSVPQPPPAQTCNNHRENQRPTEAPPQAVEERTATLGRRSTTQPPRTDPMAGRSATLLAKPVRTDPLHSPTSKRNQVQFTTFATLDIKHLAALRSNGMDVSWAPPTYPAPPPNGTEPKAAQLPEIPYPTVTPHGQV